MQNMKRQNIKIQNMKMQNMKMQNMKMQNVKMQNTKMQNMKMQNIKIQNMKMYFVVSRLSTVHILLKYLHKTNFLNLDIDSGEKGNKRYLKQNSRPECFQMTNFDRFHRQAMGVRGFNNVSIDNKLLCLSRFLRFCFKEV